MMDDTLIIVSLEPWKRLTQNQSQVAETTHRTGHHNVSGWDVRKSRESCTVPVSVPQVNKRERETEREREKERKRDREKE